MSTTITTRVEQRMRARGLSWSALARAAGVHRRTLFDYRREGWFDARLYTLLKIASGLGVSVTWMLGQGPEPEHVVVAARPARKVSTTTSSVARVRKPRTREQRRDEKRRQRARFRAAGLNAKGEPVKDRTRQDAELVRSGQCPVGCECYDCLWGEEKTNG